jgi:hypothetical protein
MNEIPQLPAYGFDPTSMSGLLSLAVTVALPILVGLLTRQSTGAGVKAVLLLAFSAVKAFLEAWLDAENSGVPFLWTAVAVSVGVNLLIAVAVHFGFFKPTGVTGAAQRSLVKDPAGG